MEDTFRRYHDSWTITNCPTNSFVTLLALLQKWATMNQEHEVIPSSTRFVASICPCPICTRSQHIASVSLPFTRGGLMVSVSVRPAALNDSVVPQRWRYFRFRYRGGACANSLVLWEAHWQNSESRELHGRIEALSYCTTHNSGSDAACRRNFWASQLCEAVSVRWSAYAVKVGAFQSKLIPWVMQYYCNFLRALKSIRCYTGALRKR